MAWLYVHFPQLQLDSVISESAEQCHQPLAIFDVQQQALTQLNHAAQTTGIRLGMGLGTAASLCRDLVMVDYDLAFSKKRLAEIAQWLYATSADMILFEPDGILLAASSMLKLYGGDTHYQKAVIQSLSVQNVTYHFAWANTALAARILARHAPLAKSSAHQPIDSETPVVTQTTPLERLNDLPVDTLEWTKKPIQQLKRMGLNHIGEVLHLPRQALGQRFGVEVLSQLAYLEGSMPMPLCYFKPPAHFQRTLVLSYEASLATALRFPLKTLLQSMERYLNEHGLLTHTVEVSCTHRDTDSPPTTFNLHSAQAEYRTEPWMALLSLKLDQLSLIAPAVTISLSSGALVDIQSQQSDLFNASSEGLTPAQLVSRLQARLGRDHVQTLSVREDYRPEYSSHDESVSDGFGSQLTATSTSASSKEANHTNRLALHQATLRPTLLFEQPKPLSQTVRIVHGPERIQCAWWTTEAICRDYFVAKTPQHETLWVFRDEQQQWFVHGLFA